MEWYWPAAGVRAEVAIAEVGTAMVATATTREGVAMATITGESTTGEATTTGKATTEGAITEAAEATQTGSAMSTWTGHALPYQTQSHIEPLSHCRWLSAERALPMHCSAFWQLHPLDENVQASLLDCIGLAQYRDSHGCFAYGM